MQYFLLQAALTVLFYYVELTKDFPTNNNNDKTKYNKINILKVHP